MPTLSPAQSDLPFAHFLAAAALKGHGRAALPTVSPLLPTAPSPQIGLAVWQQKKTAAHITANLGGRLDRNSVAGIVNLSVSHFARAFKASFGKPFAKYVQEKRLDLAQRLIAETDEPLSQVALDCGFCDQAHLSRLFARTFKIAPSAWRRHRRLAAAASPRSYVPQNIESR